MIDDPTFRIGLLAALLPLGALVVAALMVQFNRRIGLPRHLWRKPPERNYGPDLVRRPATPSVEP